MVIDLTMPVNSELLPHPPALADPATNVSAKRLKLTMMDLLKSSSKTHVILAHASQ
jgi:hypothetical protein